MLLQTACARHSAARRKRRAGGWPGAAARPLRGCGAGVRLTRSAAARTRARGSGAAPAGPTPRASSFCPGVAGVLAAGCSHGCRARPVSARRRAASSSRARGHDVLDPHAACNRLAQGRRTLSLGFSGVLQAGPSGAPPPPERAAPGMSSVVAASSLAGLRTPRQRRHGQRCAPTSHPRAAHQFPTPKLRRHAPKGLRCASFASTITIPPSALRGAGITRRRPRRVSAALVAAGLGRGAPGARRRGP